MFKSEETADEHVYNNMHAFAGYSVETKFPGAVDGLKVVQRRILWVAHKIPKNQKEASLTGEVMKMHPHGDASISDAISNMAQPFTHIIPLIFSESNIGTYFGSPPAAARYVLCGESEVAKDLFFGDINSAMYKIVVSESGDTTEPAYLIPRLPTALMISSFGIAIGWDSNTPGANPKSLCDLTREYIRLRISDVLWKEKAAKQLAKYLIPDFPFETLIRNSKIIVDNYKKREFMTPIKIDGSMIVKNDCIIVETLPPGTDFASVTFKCGQTLKNNKNSWQNQNFTQMENIPDENQGIMKGNFICVLRRGINPFDVLTKLKEELQFTEMWFPKRNYVDGDGKLVFETPMSLLSRWYNIRYSAVLGNLKQKLNGLVEKYRQLLALVIVCEDTDGVYQIFRNSKTEEETVPKLRERYKKHGLTKLQAQFLASLKFSQITSRGRDDLLKDLGEVKTQMKELQNEFHRVNEIMIESIDKFEDKWLKGPVKLAAGRGSEIYDFATRRSIIPKYIGTACYKDTGWIMLQSEDELDTILKEFDPDLIDFDFFGKTGDIVAIGAEEKIEDGEDLPKYLKAALVTKTTPGKFTACSFIKGGVMTLNGIIPRTDMMKQAIPVGNKFTIILKNGERKVIPVDSKTMRSSKDAGPTIKEGVAVSNVIDDDIIVIHGNSSQSNQICVERIVGNAKLHRIPIGNWMIIKVIPATNDKVVVNVPKEIRSRTTVRHVILDRLADYLKPGDKKILSIGRGSSGSDWDLVAWKRKSTIQYAKPR